MSDIDAKATREVNPQELVARVRTLLTLCSPAPWIAVLLNDSTDSSYVETNGVKDICAMGEIPEAGYSHDEQVRIHHDINFIAQIRTDAEALCDVVEQQAAEIERLLSLAPEFRAHTNRDAYYCGFYVDVPARMFRENNFDEIKAHVMNSLSEGLTEAILKKFQQLPNAEQMGRYLKEATEQVTNVKVPRGSRFEEIQSGVIALVKEGK